MMVTNLERSLGSGALMGLLGSSLHLSFLADLPLEVRSAVWGAVGAGLSAVVVRLAGALGRVVDAAGRRAARRIDPSSDRTDEPAAAVEVTQ